MARGGARPGAGRPKGGVSRMRLDEKFIIQEGDIEPFDPEELVPVTEDDMRTYIHECWTNTEADKVKPHKPTGNTQMSIETYIPTSRIKMVARRPETNRVTITLFDDQQIIMDFKDKVHTDGWLRTNFGTEHFMYLPDEEEITEISYPDKFYESVK